MIKRFHARAKGRGVRIIKRTSHITVTVSDEKKAKAKPAVRKNGANAPGAAATKEQN
jgi:hypothetical protein